MTAWKDMSGGLKALLLGSGAVAAAALGGLVLRQGNAPAPEIVAAAPESAAPAPADDTTAAETTTAPEPAAAPTDAPVEQGAVAAAVSPDATPAATDDAAEDVAAVDEADAAAPETAAAEPQAVPAEPAPVAEAAAAPVPPKFDVVRVAPDGSAVVAGRALPGARVALRLDGSEVAEAATDGQGKWVALFTVAPGAEPRVLTLMQKAADGTELASTESVVIAPVAAPEPAPEVLAAAEPASPPAVVETEAAADEPASDAPAVEPAEAAVAAEEPAATAATVPAKSETPTVTEAAAPAAVLVTEEGARVLQAPGPAGDAPRNVTIDAITYSAQGDVQLSGRGDAGSVVRLYVDNRPVLDASIGGDGTWGGTLPEVAAGLYALRADQINEAGRVLSRYETPFQREAPELLAAAAPDAGPDGGRDAAKITVQPGFTLWGIASQNYGEGVMYVRVYEANKELIRDPDLIYPGQVFIVPAPE